MRDRMNQLRRADQDRLKAIGELLAEYGLGISAPHRHDGDGTIAPLPLDEISVERDLKVGFVARDAVGDDVEAVGWRFANGELLVYAGCCGNQPGLTSEEAQAAG